MTWFLLACSGSPATEAVPTEVAESARPGHWKRLDALAFGHSGYTATALGDGSILILGGFSPQAELWDSELQRMRTVATAPDSRMDHAAALLPDGRVLVAGGRVSDGGQERRITDSTLLYDPVGDHWDYGPVMGVGRTEFSLSVLGEQVLACGGVSGESSTLVGPCETLTLNATCPEQDPDTVQHELGCWTKGPQLAQGRRKHSATLVGDAVYLVGGEGVLGPVAKVERFSAEGLRAVGDLSTARHGHHAFAVGGALWVTGGIDENGSALARVEVYDGDSWTEPPPMNHARALLGGGALPDGRVVLFGGTPIPDSPDVLALREVEIYEDGAWVKGSRLVKGRYDAPTVTLPNGVLVFAGGQSRGKPILDITSFSQEDKPPRQKTPEDLPALEEAVEE